MLEYMSKISVNMAYVYRGDFTVKMRALLIVLMIVLIALLIVAVCLGISARNDAMQNKNPGTNPTLSTPNAQETQPGGTEPTNPQNGNSETSPNGEYVVVSTPYGNLKYSEQWSEFMHVYQQNEENAALVSFSAAFNETEYPLFTIILGEYDAEVIAEIQDANGQKHNVYVLLSDLNITEELTEDEINRLYAMQEEINEILQRIE